MRPLFKVFVLFFLLVPFTAFAGDFGPVRLSLIDGDVQVLVQDTTDWTAATINLPLNEHDRVWVGEGSRAELQIQGGVYARADGNSSLDLLTVNRDSAQFYLDQGHIYVNNRRGGINTVQIDTPLASLRTYDNSIVMVDVGNDGVNEVSVLKGTVYAESRAGATTVSAGSTLTIRNENSAELSPISPPDQWEQWNIDRDQQVSAWTESSRYLPDELHEYSSDFDQNGQWQYDSQYGYVWSPAAVGPDWSPYSYGSWVWIRNDYVWIDYAPWGWAPFHYGRWVLVGGAWCWVPPVMGSVYWSPGYVGWVVTPTYVAWVPLAPGEIYYGHGYYGPGSVNITTVNINTVVVNRTYRNAHNPRAIVAVNRDNFGTGRREPVKLKENPFEGKHRPDQNTNFMPPHTRPAGPVSLKLERHEARPPASVREERDRRHPTGPEQVRPQTPAPAGRGGAPAVQEQVHTTKQPPDSVRRTRPEAVKNERPLVRQREASVFHPRPPDNLPVTRSQEPRVINRNPGGGQPAQQHRQEKPGPGQGQRKSEERH